MLDLQYFVINIKKTYFFPLVIRARWYSAFHLFKPFELQMFFKAALSLSKTFSLPSSSAFVSSEASSRAVLGFLLFEIEIS